MRASTWGGAVMPGSAASKGTGLTRLTWQSPFRAHVVGDMHSKLEGLQEPLPSLASPDGKLEAKGSAVGNCQ